MKIVMTLLVPRQPRKDAAFGLQITYPFQLIPELVSLTEVRLLDENGRRATEEETWKLYHPEEWRAATCEEQREYLQRFGIPQPWFSTMHRVYRSVYDVPDSGDMDTNNGQQWNSIDAQWNSEERLRDQYRDEEEAWQERTKAEYFRRFQDWGEG